MTTNEQLEDKLDKVMDKVMNVESSTTDIRIQVAVMTTHIANFTAQIADLKSEVDAVKKSSTAAHSRLDNLDGRVYGVKFMGWGWFLILSGLFTWCLITLVDHSKSIATLFSKGGPHG